MGHYEYETEDEIKAYEAAKKRYPTLGLSSKTEGCLLNTIPVQKDIPKTKEALDYLKMKVEESERLTHNILSVLKGEAPSENCGNVADPKKTLNETIASHGTDLAAVNARLSEIAKILYDNLGDDIKLV